MRIGITGYAESGKDVLADILVREFGFVKINMSDPLDKYLQILNPYILDELNGTIRYTSFRSLVSYVDSKKNPEVRRLLQVFGTEVGRAIDNDIWVKERIKTELQFENTVTTGIRYPNEAVGFDQIWKVERKGFGPKNEHSSEQLDEVFELADVTFYNDWSLDYFRTTATTIIEALIDGFNIGR